MTEFERKPDGGLNAWIETYEAMRGDETDAEMLCLLLELRRRRENQAETERERDELRAEIARRDAEAGEPVAWLNDAYLARGVLDGETGKEDQGPGYIPVYRIPPPAVLSPEKITEIMQDAWNEFCDDTGCYPDDFEYQNEKLFFDAGRWAMLVAERISSLGAQQQKVVELPEPVKWPEIPFRYFSEEQVFSMLDAAGVKWEVKK